MTPQSAADFERMASTAPERPSRYWKWAAFRDFAEERTPLAPAECRAAYNLGRDEPDANLGVAIMCAVLYMSTCPGDLLDDARLAPHSAVRRTVGLRRRRS